MESLLQFATNDPILFGLMITVAFLLLQIATFMIGLSIPAGIYKPHIGQMLGRLTTTLILIFILWRFGWLTSAGFTRLGGWQFWLLTLLLFIYVFVGIIHAYFGDFRFDLSKPKLVGVVTLSQLTIGLVEETAFRGVVLYTFVRLWGDSSWGLAGSVLLSALFFGLPHMIWVIIGKPALQSMLMSLSAFEAGIYYGTFVLASGSIWPAVIFHGFVDAVVNVKLIGEPEYKEPASSGIRVVLLNLPVVIYALFLLWRISPFATIPQVP